MKTIKSILIIIFIGITIVSFSQSEEICKSITINIPTWLEAKNPDSLYSHFDKTMSKSLKSPDLMKMWEQLIMMNGSFKNADGLKQFNNDGLLIYERTIFFEQSGLIMRVAFDKENKIAGLFFRPNRTEKSPNKLESNDYFKEEHFQKKEQNFQL
jgi:hypothetical protein